MTLLLLVARCTHNRVREWLGRGLCSGYQFIRTPGATYGRPYSLTRRPTAAFYTDIAVFLTLAERPVMLPTETLLVVLCRLAPYEKK
jgi:hypothetical protein